MLGKEMLTKLYDYNYWANARILEHTARLSQEQFAASSGYSHGSLRHLLFHMLRTEWVWRNLSQYGQIPITELPRAEDFTSLEQIRTRWQAEEQHMRAFLDGLDDEKLANSMQLIDPRDGSQSEGIPWQMLAHVLLHNMQHRSEAAALLTSYGQSPGDLDFIFYL